LALLIAALATSLLFLMMQRMVLRDGGIDEIVGSERLLDFIRQERDNAEDRPREVREPPPPPQTPEAEPVSDALAEIDVPLPLVSPELHLPMPKLDLSGIKAGLDPAITNGLQVGSTIGGLAGAVPGGGDVVPLVRIKPRYPAGAARKGIEGWVKVMFTISENGSVKNVRIVDADPRRVFERAATKAISRWRFKPRLVDGAAVQRDGVVQTLRFNLAKEKS
jgi:protein TonB